MAVDQQYSINTTNIRQIMCFQAKVTRKSFLSNKTLIHPLQHDQDTLSRILPSQLCSYHPHI